MDDCFVVYQLQRNQNNRNLFLEKELIMKEIHTIDFKPKAFDTTIICNNYAIQGKRIFYLYDISEEPYPDGVFESEDLIP